MTEEPDRHICIEVIELDDDVSALALHVALHVVGIHAEEAVAILTAARDQLAAEIHEARAGLN